MFVGEYNHTMDAKGRIFMPAKMRDGLSEQFYIARGIDKCICIYPGLGKDVVVVGNNTCIEIWSTEGWAEEQKYFDNELVEKELIGLGF